MKIDTIRHSLSRIIAHAVSDLFAKAKFDWNISLIDLGDRFIEASKLTDYPRMLKKINHQEWRNFFLEEARKLKKEIIKQ